MGQIKKKTEKPQMLFYTAHGINCKGHFSKEESSHWTLKMGSNFSLSQPLLNGIYLTHWVALVFHFNVPLSIVWYIILAINTSYTNRVFMICFLKYLFFVLIKIYIFMSVPWIISYYEFPTLILLYNKLLIYSESRKWKTLAESSKYKYIFNMSL